MAQQTFKTPEADIETDVKPEEPSSKPVTNCTVPDIIGGPPEVGTGITQTNDLLNNSRMILDVYPMTTKIDNGISLFTLEPDWENYTKILGLCGIAEPKGTKGFVRLACQADAFPSDTFQNDYGDHFLSNMMDIGGSAFTQLGQMGGKRGEGFAVAKDLTKMMAAAGEGEGVVNQILRAAGGVGASVLETGEQYIEKFEKLGPRAASMASAMRSLLGGARIDFPMIWKNSSYNPVFSITVRLYNPHPAKDISTRNHIIAPLGALLALGLPQAKLKDDGKGDDGFGFYWPFFVKVKCPGVFDIKMGAIQSINITKGGDQSSVSYNQRLGIVDVRMEFINLHNVMIAMSSKMEERPTLKGYLDNIMEQKPIIKINKGDSTTVRAISTGISATQFAVGAMQSKIGTDIITQAPSRITSVAKSIATTLAAGTPPGFLS